MTRPTGRCGSNAGYMRHRRAGEKPCDACRKAHTAMVAGRGKSQAKSPVCECGTRIYSAELYDKCSNCRNRPPQPIVIDWRKGPGGIWRAISVREGTR